MAESKSRAMKDKEEGKRSRRDKNDKKKKENGLLGNKELVDKVLKLASAEFSRFESDREDFDDKLEKADYMYAAGQSRTLLSSEKSKGVNQTKDTRANTGSIVFHRQVNTMAAQMVGVMRSRPDLAKYEQQTTDGIPASYEDSLDRAQQQQALVRWTLKRDGFNKKIPEFAVSVYKNSTIFALVTQKRTYKRKLCVVPVYGPQLDEAGQPVPDQETGQPIQTIVDEQRYWDELLVDNHPSITFPHPSNIYADRFIPDIQGQNFVFTVCPRNRTEIWNDVAQGFFSKEAYEKLDDSKKWDGHYGNVAQEKERDNREHDTTTPSDSDQFLQWDFWARLSISDGEYDEDAPPELYWITAIGNTVESAVVMRFERNPDPDDEIPLQVINVMPDCPNELYHTTTGEIIRSDYSVACTLKNMFIDNTAYRTDPPQVVVEGAHRVKNFSIESGKLFHVFQKDAITPYPIADATQNIVPLLQMVDSDIKQALATDPAMMGQYAGSRTPATEFLGVNQNTNKVHYMQINYVLNQLVPWMYRKIPSYWKAYGDPKQVLQIADGEKIYEIRPQDISGDFDVNVSVLDEYLDDMVKQQTDREILQLIASNPQFVQSETHRIDMGAFLKEMLEHRKYPATRLILPASGRDAEELARSRVAAMLNAGVYIAPQEGESFSTHLRIAEAERVRWNGLEDANDPRAKNIPLLDQYIDELRVQMKAQQQQNQGSPMGVGGPRTPGMVVGQEGVAGQLGAALGG